MRHISSVSLRVSTCLKKGLVALFQVIEFHNISKIDFLVLEKESFSTINIMLLNLGDIKATMDSVMISVNGSL